jgi:hypothetical protein
VSELPGALVIVHLPEVHQQVTDLLAHLESSRENADPTATIRLTNFAASRFEQRLQRILAQPCQVELFRADLATALKYLSRQLDVPIVVSSNLRYHAALQKPAAVTVRSEGAPLNRVLNEILTPLELTFRVRRDCIEIVPLLDATLEREFRLYPVGDLIGDAKGTRIEQLSALLSRFVELPFFAGAAERSTWTSELGDRMLLVEATAETHDRAQRLLADLRACLVGLPPPVNPGERSIQSMLDQPADLEFIHASLPSVVAWIEQNYGVPLEIDPPILAEPPVRITCRAQSNWLGVALRNVLGSVEMDYVVLPDRVLVTDLRGRRVSPAAMLRRPTVDRSRRGRHDRADVDCFPPGRSQGEFFFHRCLDFRRNPGRLCIGSPTAAGRGNPGPVDKPFGSSASRPRVFGRVSPATDGRVGCFDKRSKRHAETSLFRSAARRDGGRPCELTAFATAAGFNSVCARSCC